MLEFFHFSLLAEMKRVNLWMCIEGKGEGDIYLLYLTKCRAICFSIIKSLYKQLRHVKCLITIFYLEYLNRLTNYQNLSVN